MPRMTDTDRQTVVDALNEAADRLYAAIHQEEEAGYEVDDNRHFDAQRVRRLARWVRNARRVDVIGSSEFPLA